MAVHDLYSKRQKRLRGEYPDVYQYHALPLHFRRQVVYILRDVLGQNEFSQIHDTLAREYGEFQLPGQGHHYQTLFSQPPNYQMIVCDFLCSYATVEQALDVIELSFQVAYENSQDTPAALGILPILDEAVDELNARFREHGIGYQFESGQVVRVDSKFLHQEVVRPALQILQAPHFSGAEKEFLEAHKHYREHEFEDAISDSLKALESTLKVICQRQGWPFDEKRATASTLIQIIFDNDLIPPYLQSQFNSLQSILESGVPTIRNRDGGHGSGATPRDVPAHLAAYALHLTASAIVFLAEAERVK